MSVAGRVLELVDDRLNPIVVKELRQAVYGRFLAGTLLLFLLFQLTTLALFLVSNGISTIDVAGGGSYGDQVFGILIGILVFATVVCVPVYAAIRIYGERSGQSMALFFISTLSPRRIVAGKLASNLALTLLIQSACLPYLSFTYFLRGIDLPTVFVALTVDLLASALAIQSAIFVAAFRVSRILQVLIGMAGLGWLVTLFSLLLAYVISLPMQGVGSQLASWSFWGPAAMLLVAGGVIFGLLFVLSVAIITPANANRARPVRLYALAAWSVATLATAYACHFHAEKDVVLTWLLVTYAGLGLSYLPAISARDRMGLRVAREVPRARWWRPAAFLVFSGSANGVAFTTVMLAATALVTEVFDHDLAGDLAGIPEQYLGFGAFCLAYALLGLQIQRRLVGRWIRRSQTWVVALTLIGFLSLVPPLIGFVVAPDELARSADFGWLLVANPFAPFQSPFGVTATRFGLGAAVVMSLLAAGWLGRQVLAFHPPARLEAAMASAAPATAEALEPDP